VLVAFSDNAVVDGDGPDFKVYGESMRDDYLQVEVSADGEIWHAYPRASESPPGFDLAEAGLNRAVFVRLTDLQPATPSGAEVDAIVALHNGPVLQSRLPTLPDAIAGQDLTLYERPATEKQMSGSVARGQPLDLLGRDDQGEWAKVRTTRGAPTQGWCSVTGLVLNVSLRDLSPLIISTTPTPKSAQVSPTKTVAYPVPSNTPDSAGSPWILVADSKTDYPGPTQNRKWWYLWSTNRYTFNWQDMQWDDSTYCYRSSSNENMRICKDQITNNGRGDVALLWKARQGGTYRFEWDSGALLFYQHLGFVGAQGPGPTLANSAIVYDVIDWELFFWVARTNTPYHVRVHRLKE
jgi:hypothetical protein